MTSIETTAFAGLEKESRLLNAVFKGPTGKPGYYGFRGDFALKFQPQLADEARPPEYKLEQIVAVAKEGTGTIEILAGYLHDFAYFETFKEVVGPLLSPEGSYFIFVNNIDLLAKYTMPLGDATDHRPALRRIHRLERTQRLCAASTRTTSRSSTAAARCSSFSTRRLKPRKPTSPFPSSRASPAPSRSRTATRTARSDPPPKLIGENR